ncbi:MAG: FAD:protein FMN transferase [Hungatella sp.]|nr:FAD:protein FMN transferase [Hungatella sp.]
MKRGRITAFLLAAALMGASAGAFAGCKEKESEPELNRYDVQFLDLFDTVTSMIGYVEDEETFRGFSQELYEELKTYHQLYDIYNDYEGIANIKTINDKAGIEPVKVDQRIIDMLKEAVEMDKATNGYMNVAMGSVLSIWHKYRTEGSYDPDNAQLPPREELLEAAEHMDINQVIIDEEASTVFLPDPDMSLDVGSIAKGYATEMVCRKLEEDGLTKALVSVGGNVRAIGSKGDESLWKVGIQNPDLSSQTRYLHTVGLEDMSLVTSGSYQRFYTVDQKNYHHIIHPELLMPWDEYDSVSILCGDSGMADCLSTAVFNMEFEDGKALIEAMDQVEAMWIFKDGREEYSSGFKKFMEEE